MVKTLLHSGANICIKNKNRDTAVKYISPRIFQDYLDECIDETDDKGNRKQLTDDEYPISFKYSFLGPAKINRPNHHEIEVITENLPEAEPLWHLSKSKEHHSLLEHPLITSFLFLKWQHIWPVLLVFLFFHQED